MCLSFQGDTRRPVGPVNKRTPANSVPGQSAPPLPSSTKPKSVNDVSGHSQVLPPPPPPQFTKPSPGHSPMPPPLPKPPPMSAKPNATEPGPVGRRQPAAFGRHSPASDDDDDGLPPPPSANVPAIRVGPSPPQAPPPPPLSNSKLGPSRRLSHERRPSDSGLIPPSTSTLPPRRPSYDNLLTTSADTHSPSMCRRGMQPPPPPPNRQRPAGDGSMRAPPPNVPPPPPPRKSPTLSTARTGTTGRPSKATALGQVNDMSVGSVSSLTRPLPPSAGRPSGTLTNGIDGNSSGT